MRVLYHLTIPQPLAPELDAIVQEVEALRAAAGGEIIYVNPTRYHGSRFPERLYGLHRLPDLLRRETDIDVHHIYNARPYLFPYLRLLRKPVVYTVAAGLRSTERSRDRDRLAALARIIVNSTRDLETLRGWGLRNVELIRPGIDVSRFRPAPPPADPPFTLLMGSAPWTLDQFGSKGVDALLQAVQARSDLRLVFLWRGLLYEEMQRRIAQAELGQRVTIINQHVDVNDVLAQVHAAVVLAHDATLVKAYPHSLMEALAAGRPVLISRAIPMADTVEQTHCGQIVDAVDARSVLDALARLKVNYESHRRAALAVGQRDFSRQVCIEAHLRLYASVQTR